jgi:hypothetical protein
MHLSAVLAAIPQGLRDPLLAEYNSIVSHYLEAKWKPSELSGGLFCEIVYTILDGYGRNSYAAKPTKPNDFPSACRTLEQHANSPRSFRILIPRALPALYEVRNNRNVGHVGGDVDPNEMDASLVLHTTTWVMAELIRVLHQLYMKDAQAIVDKLIERKTPLVWDSGTVKRVLIPTLKRPKQILVLLAATSGAVTCSDMRNWIEEDNEAYFKKVLGALHGNRLIEWNMSQNTITLLPPGTTEAEEIIRSHMA